ncbi:hypothetical protein [Alkalispirochaeta alkalica]|uniref:hypothetical protein n=1 Tax=Alkalispirochaeta alkalica TaxID=46356 RepID=UPI00036D72B5|nr:hypothetical protein [Alkalispirochaeta alkalica]
MKRLNTLMVALTSLITFTLLMGSCDLLGDSDDNEKNPRVIVQNYNEEGDAGDRTIFNFNSAGKIANREEIRTNGRRTLRKYTFNDDGDIIKGVFKKYDGSGELTHSSERTFEYINMGIAGDEIVRKDGSTTDRRMTITGYDNIQLRFDGSQSVDYLYHYDGDNERWDRIEHKKGNYDTFFHYNEDGQLEYTAGSTFTERFIYQNGKLSEVEIRATGGRPHTEFDEMAFIVRQGITWRGSPTTDLLHPAFGDIYGYGLTFNMIGRSLWHN